MQFDELLDARVGGFGRAQLLVLLAASASWASLAAAVLVMVFATAAPPWRCVRGADDAVCAAALAAGGDPCGLPRADWAFVAPRSSIVATFELQCGGGWAVTAANSVFFGGYAVGSFLFGWLADRHGRRLALVTANAAAAAAALGCAAAPGLAAHVAARMLLGAAAAGLPVAAYTLATESVGPAARGRAGTGSQLIYHVGELALPLAAAGLQDWRALYVAIALLLAATGALAAAVPESPRWQLLHGRRDEAYRTLSNMAALNGRPAVADWAAVLDGSGSPDVGGGSLDVGGEPGAAAPDAAAPGAVPPADGDARDVERNQQQLDGADCVALLAEHGAPKQAAAAAANKGAGDRLLMVFTDPLLARFFWVCALLCAAMATSFFTANLATEQLRGSLHWQYFLTSVGEVPATLAGAAAVDALGRRPTICAGLLLSGAACLLCAGLTGAAATAAACAGKAAVSASWSLSFVWSAELLPTTLRSSALAASNQAARLGGIAAPFIILGARRWGAPKAAWGGIGAGALAVAALALLLPETLGRPQPDTLAHLRELYGSGGSSSGGSSGRLKAAHSTALPVGRSVSYRVAELVAAPAREDRGR